MKKLFKFIGISLVAFLGFLFALGTLVHSSKTEVQKQSEENVLTTNYRAKETAKSILKHPSTAEFIEDFSVTNSKSGGYAKGYKIKSENDLGMKVYTWVVVEFEGTDIETAGAVVDVYTVKGLIKPTLYEK